MELHYYKKIEEDKEYQTWFYDKGRVVLNRWYMGLKGDTKLFKVPIPDNPEDEYVGEVGGYDDGWTKLPMPDNLTDEGKLEWMMISNKEDLHFIMKEREACAEWMMKNMDEILEAQKENKKIKKFFQKNLEV